MSEQNQRNLMVQEHQNEELSIWDESPGSLINMLPDEVRAKLLKAQKENPDLFTMDEQELSKALRSLNQTPTATDNRLRLKFWYEFDRAKENGSNKIVIANVIAGVCSKELFYKHYLARAGKCSWLVCPPSNYKTKIVEALEFGIDQLRDILETPHYELNKDGSRGPLNTKVASLKVAIFKMLDDRKNGVAKQVIEGKVGVLHAAIPTVDRKLIAEMAQNKSEDELMLRLENLKRKERQVLHLDDRQHVVQDAESGEAGREAKE